MNGQSISPHCRYQQGFTLIELLVGIAVGVIIIGAAFSALTMTRKGLTANEQTVDMQQNARLAMELLSRDIKVAGFGNPGVIIGNCSVGTAPVPIRPGDQNPAGADSGPDSVQLLIPTTKSQGATRWTLTSPVTADAVTILPLQPGAVADMVASGLANGSYISLGGAATVQVSGVNAAGNTITVSFPIESAWFPPEEQVHLLQCIRYQVVQPPDPGNLCLGRAPCLTRGIAGVTTGPAAEAPIAEGIEDLQLSYACDGCVASLNGGTPDRIIDDQNANGVFDQADFLSNVLWATVPLTPDKIQLVHVALVARQLNDDQGLGEVQGASIGSGAVVVTADRSLTADLIHRRRVLRQTVETRNVGL